MLLMCIKIFIVRIIDVSLGTVRAILTIKEKNLVASLVGFIEVFIWFIIVKDALNTDIKSIFIPIFYAGGFGTGTYIGGILAKYFTKNSIINVQVIINKYNNKLVDMLYTSGYAVSTINIEGYNNIPKLLLIIETKINRLKELRSIINKIDNKAFIVVSESRIVYNGYLK